MSNLYDKDYFERGIESGKSQYQNYRWMPEATIAMAMKIIDLFQIKPCHTILDYGCAKGYLVRAFRLLHRKAWGVDISNYAISCVDQSVSEYCALFEDYLINKQFPEVYDFCIAKDVFEHLIKVNLKDLLINMKAREMLVVVPLGENGKYNAHANNLDKTHLICENKEWWISLFSDNGWKVNEMTTRIRGIKESYNGIDNAHGFFFLSNNNSEVYNYETVNSFYPKG